jgi:hypothetical protein
MAVKSNSIGSKTAGHGAPPAALPPISEVVVGALGLPNIDGKESVLANLPTELCVAGRIDFAVDEGPAMAGVRFGQPRAEEWVRVHPTLGTLMQCIKDVKNMGRLRPVTVSLMKHHPRIAAAAKLHTVRLTVIDDSDELLLWATPHPTASSTPGDRVWRQAQSAAVTNWVTIWWDGHARHWAPPEKPETFQDPVWPERDFAEILQAGVADDLMWDPSDDYAQKLMRAKQPSR